MPKYDDIQVGDKAEVSHVITELDLEKFVALTGDDNRLHIDADFASQTPLGARVVHGMLGASFISTVIGTKIPGDGALWFSQTLEFILPVRVGDRIKVVATVIEKVARDSVIVLSTEIFNQDKQKVTSGVAKVKAVVPLAKKGVRPERIGSAKRLAIVIGATGGVGESVARSFASRGHDLILAYRSSEAKAQELRAELTLMGIQVKLVQGDICEESCVEQLKDCCNRFFNGLDYVVNTATAPIAIVSLNDLDWDDFEKHLFSNIKSSYFLAKHLSPLMAGRSAPGFVFISSQATESPVRGWLPYVTAKSALNGFARSLATELAPLGIRVNLVSPGMIDTNLVGNMTHKARLMVEARCPLGRLATADDVAAAVSYLSSDSCSYVTGETIRVNGGQVML